MKGAWGVFGRPGQGKSYLMALLAAEALRQNRPVYSNMPIVGTLYLDCKWLEQGSFPEGSRLLIDEAGIEWNSRDWKNFSRETYLMFATYRHYKLDLAIAVQDATSVDLNIRRIIGTWVKANNRLFVFRYDLYDTLEDYEHDLEAGDNRRRLGSFWKLKRKKVFASFDSYEDLLGDRPRVPVVPWDGILTGIAPKPEPLAIARRRAVRTPAPCADKLGGTSH